jgi:hypothetical protein
MRKLLAIFFLICFCSFANGQEVLVKIASNYFRINPFNQNISQFLNQLINDPGIANKTVRKKTDSSLFQFMAEYKNFSPYSFLADRTEIRFFEKQMDIGDSTSVMDTVYIYQLMGYSNGKGGLEIVKKEFDKFHKRFQKQLIDFQSSELKKNDEVVGGIINYFVFGTTVSPLSISWIKLDENQNAFSILFRFKMDSNEAILPVAADSR